MGIVLWTWAFCLPVLAAGASSAPGDPVVVEDFESYTDEQGKLIYEVWRDGWFDNSSGSLVGYVDTGWHPDVVHGGRQAMPLEYNNVGVPYYSRVTRTWDVPQDWTVNHVADLSLWVHGWPVAFCEKPDGQIVLSGLGWDADTGEGFRYAYKELRGDGEIVARVDSFRSSSGWAGAMVRETAERWREPPAVKFAALVVTPTEGVSFLYRRAPDEPKERRSVPGVHAPCWVKLIRRGDTFTARFSTDGAAWQDFTDSNGAAPAVSILMPEPAYIGLCVTSDAWSYSPGIAEFSQVSVIGSSPGPWQDDAINTWGGDWGNAPAALYVAVEDTTGWRAVAVNRAAVNLNEWTQWRIPLSEFSDWGVNLKAIKTMYIDIGDKSCPQPDGSGRIYIDDICLLPRAQAAALSPADGDVNVAQTPALKWAPAGTATHSDIYLGTDPDAVANATPATAGIYQGRQPRGWDEMRYEPGELEWNKTWYWRVDEVNDAHPESPCKGPVWRFQTADFLVIDDFENWPGPHCEVASCETWIDGWMDGRSGSWVGHLDAPFAEQAIVHGGRLSLPVDYNNVDQPFYSEIWREHRFVHDWTIKGGDTLVLFIHGLATNDPAPVYVSFSARKTVWVFHPDPQLTRATQWIEWRVPLSTLPGIDPTNVEVIRIGVGNPKDPTLGGRGRIYLDDIRVIKSTP